MDLKVKNISTYQVSNFGSSVSSQRTAQTASDTSIFAAPKSSEAKETDKVLEDQKNGFKPKDFLDIYKIFENVLGSQDTKALTYMLTTSALKQFDTDHNSVLTSGEYKVFQDQYANMVPAAQANGKNEQNTKNNVKNNPNMIQNIIKLLSGADVSSTGIPEMEEVKKAYTNSLQMMDNADKNHNGKIEKEEFNTLVDQKAKEPLSEEEKQAMFVSFSGKQEDLNISDFMQFAFKSDLAWDSSKKLNKAKLLNNSGKNAQ
jgi:Ca2+-binding EF-hand superfamily protein